MSFEGPQFEKLNGGLGGRTPSGDKVKGLIAGGVVTAGYPTLGEVVELIQLSDAEDLGFDAAYDANNKVQVHYEIEEFFKNNPDGTCWLMVVPQGTSQTDMVDKDNAFAWKMMTDEKSRGKVRIIGTKLNPAAAYAPDNSGGIDADVLTAIPKAQELVSALAAEGILLDGVILEGRNLTDTFNDIPDYRTMASRNVSVVCGCDPAVVALLPEYAGTAAVGTVLKGLSVRQISENLGSTDILNKQGDRAGDSTFPLNDRANGRWESAALSNGMLFSELSKAQQALLDTRGHIYIGKFEDNTGYFFNNSHTCTDAADDYAFIENNRIWNKAVRLVNAAMIPKIRGKFKKDVSTGYPTAPTIEGWKARIKKSLSVMIDDNDISGTTEYIDPAQDIGVGKPLKVKIGLIIDGVLHEMLIQVGLSNPAANS